MQIEAPGTIKITVKAIDESGIDFMFVQFYNADYDKTITTYLDYDENTDLYIGHIDINEYALPGTYYINYAYARDYAGNEIIYSESYDNLSFTTNFFVINDDTLDLTTNTKNPNLINDIKNTEDGSKILIDYSSGSKVSSDIFDAIKGTNKEIIFQQNGVQWVFNGQDITSTKDIDLNVEIKPISNYYSDNATEISDIVKDKPSVVIDFESNGELPGKALIRVKADYEFIEYLGSKDLYVYYFDKTTNSM
ncbi:MAG: hypothetical protein ACK5LC_03785, partial [Coprobacillaceae bacterium]